MNKIIIIIMTLSSLVFHGCDNPNVKAKYIITGDCAIISIDDELYFDLNESEEIVKYISPYGEYAIDIYKMTNDTTYVHLRIYYDGNEIYNEYNNEPYGELHYTR